MQLTQNQLDALRADILANQDTSAAYAAGDRALLADLYNAPASPAVSAWDTAVSVERVHNAIDDTKYTPADAPVGDLLYLARATAIQIKQMNLQTLVMGQDYLNGTIANVRTKLKDATTGVPAGVNGANTNPGGAAGANVLNALLRPSPVTRIEKLLSAGPQTTGTVTGEVLTETGPISTDVFIDV